MDRWMNAGEQRYTRLPFGGTINKFAIADQEQIAEEANT